LGDVWHPLRGFDPEHIRDVKERHLELRVISRDASENVEAMRDAGPEGAVITFPDGPAMRDFAVALSSPD
jgi:hypothetical protein